MIIGGLIIVGAITTGVGAVHIWHHLFVKAEFAKLHDELKRR